MSESTPASTSNDPATSQATEEQAPVAPVEGAQPAAEPAPMTASAAANEEAPAANDAEAEAAQASEPAQAAPAAQAAEPAPAAISTEAEKQAASFGRVEADGSVYVRDGDTERKVGEYAASGSSEAALAIYVHRYIELLTQVDLLEQRVEIASPDDARKSLVALTADLKEPAAVGDLPALRARVEKLSARIEERRAQVAEERKAAREAAIAQRTVLVERAEALAAQDPEQTHWKNTRAELQSLFEEWQREQKEGTRIDRPTEQKLWKRFSQARSTFDRARRKHFAELDAVRSEVVSRKEALIKEAAALQNSTDWGATAARYRELMDEWRRAGRARRKEDDALWQQFREAQQPFFDARSAHFAQQDEAREGNLEQKLKLVQEAEKVLEIKDPERASAKLREIGEQWDEIGDVPRKDLPRTEGRLREIEDSVRNAEEEEWRRKDPEKQARSNGMAEQLEHLIAELDGQIEEARAKGDEAALKELEEARAARAAWLDQVSKEL